MKRLFLAVALMTVGCKEQAAVVPRPVRTTPAKHNAKIVDGPEYLASKKTAEQLEAKLQQYQANSVEVTGMEGQPHDDGNGIAVDPDTIPARTDPPSTPPPGWSSSDPINNQIKAATPYPGPTPPKDSPECLTAMQVIGHDGEAVIGMGGPVENRDGLENALNVSKMAELLIKATTRITTTGDVAYCQKIIDKTPRMYPSYLDQHDHMSTGRIIGDITQLRILAAEKAQLETEANRDISH